MTSASRDENRWRSLYGRSGAQKLGRRQRPECAVFCSPVIKWSACLDALPPTFLVALFPVEVRELYSLLIVTSCYIIIIAILTYQTLQMNYKERISAACSSSSYCRWTRNFFSSMVFTWFATACWRGHEANMKVLSSFFPFTLLTCETFSYPTGPRDAFWDWRLASNLRAWLLATFLEGFESRALAPVLLFATRTHGSCSVT